MMQAVFYRKSDGSEPADPPLPSPHSSQVEGGLPGLRCHYGNVLYRILYQRSENLFILLRIVRKDRGNLLEADITIAQERWEDFRARMNVDPLRGFVARERPQARLQPPASLAPAIGL